MSTTLGQLRINIGVDSSDFEKNIQAVQRELKTANERFKAVSSTTDKYGKSVEELGNDSKALEGVLKQQYIIVQKNKDEWEKHKATLGEFSVESQKAEQAYLKSVSAMNKTQNQIEGLENSIKKLREEEAKNRDVWGNSTKAMQDFGQSTMDVGKKIRDVSGSIARDFGAMTLAVGGALGMAVKSAADFEQGLSNVKAVSGASAEEMQKMNDQALDLGATTKYSATEVTKAQEELIKAGLNVGQVLTSTSGALNLATAGDLELAQAAEIAGIALNSFKAEALTMDYVADHMAGAANASATSVEEMQYGMSMSAAVASGLGVKFEDLNTTLAVFANNGLKGSDAGTSLKTMMLNLQPTTNDQIALFQQLGITGLDAQKAMDWLTKKGVKPLGNDLKTLEKQIKDQIQAESNSKLSKSKLAEQYQDLLYMQGLAGNQFFDTNGKIKSQGEIAEVLKKSMEGLTDQQRQLYLEQMFGTDAIRAANIMTREGADGFKIMAGEIEKISAADVAKTKMDNLNGSLEELKGSFETMKISIGNALMPTIKNLVKGFQGLIDKFNGLSPKTKENIARFGLIATAVLGAVTVFGMLGIALGGIVIGFGAMSVAMGFLLSGPGLAVIGTLAAIVGGIKLVSGAMSESVLDTDRFGEGISKGTQKALDSYYKLSDDARAELVELQLTNKEVTEEQKTKVVGIYQTMTDEIIAKMQDRAKKEKIEAQRILLNNTSMTEAQKAVILANMEVQAKNEEDTVRKTQDRLIAIYTKAAEEKRDTTAKENKEIERLTNELDKKAVESMAKNEIELKNIQERIKNTRKDITAEQTANYIKEANKQTKEAVDAAEDEYNETLNFYIKLRDEKMEISQSQFEQYMEDAEKHKNESIKKAEEERNGVIKQAILKNSEYMSEVNFTTGEIMTTWDKITGKSNQTLNDNYDTALTLGMYLNQETGKWVDATAEATDDMKNKSNSAKLDLEKAWNGVKGKFSEVAEQVKTNFGGIDLFQIGKNIIQGLLNGMKNTDLAKTISEVGTGVTNTFKKFFDINSPSKKMNLEVGQWITKGVGQGMLDNVDFVENASAQVSKAVQIQGSMGASGMVGAGATNNTYTNNITIQGGNNAYEIARQQELLLRRLQFQGGIPR